MLQASTGLLQSEIWVQGFKVGPAQVPGQFSVAILTAKGATLSPIDIALIDGALVAGTSGMNVGLLTGAPVVDGFGHVVAILDGLGGLQLIQQ